MSVALATTPPRIASGPPFGHARIIDPAAGDPVQAAVFRRAALPPGAGVAGPAVIVEDGTSTILPAGFAARVAADGEIIIEEDAA